MVRFCRFHQEGSFVTIYIATPAADALSNWRTRPADAALRRHRAVARLD